MQCSKGPWEDPQIQRLLDSEPLEEIMTPDGARKLHQKLLCQDTEQTPEQSPELAEGPIEAVAEMQEKTEAAFPVVAEEDEEALDSAPAGLPGSSPTFNLELEQAEQAARELAEEHRKLEEEHMRTLAQWVEEFNRHVSEIGRYTIERAQSYYDCLALWNQVVQEYVRQHDEVALVTKYFEKAMRDLTRAEAALEVCGRGLQGELTQEQWDELCPLPEEAKEAASDQRLDRMYRVSLLANQVTTLQRQRDAARVQLKVKDHEVDKARRNFQQEEALHKGCTVNCSVKRAAPFYERRKVHESTVEAQLAALHAAERRLHDARHRVVQLQMEEKGGRVSPSNRSVVSALYRRTCNFDEMSLQSFEITGGEPGEEDFLSCASGGS